MLYGRSFCTLHFYKFATHNVYVVEDRGIFGLQELGEGEQLTQTSKACVPKTVFAMLRGDHSVMGVREPACVAVFSR